MPPRFLNRKYSLPNRLTKRTVIPLYPTPPYDFTLTSNYATYFSDRYVTQRFSDGIFKRLLDLEENLCLVKVRSTGKPDSPELEIDLRCTFLEDSVVSQVRKQVADLLGTAQELAPFYRMAFKDPDLKPLVRGLRGLHIPQAASVWEALVSIIIGQQVHSNVALMVRNLLVQTYGFSLKDSGVTYYTFPRPEIILETGIKGLRSIKLSKQKARFIVEIAAALVSQDNALEILHNLDDQDVIRNVMRMKGVGPWSANWLLIRGLCRPDAFPCGDLALRRSMAKLCKDDSLLLPEKAMAYAVRWSPFRSYVTTYIFAALRSGLLNGLVKAI